MDSSILKSKNYLIRKPFFFFPFFFSFFTGYGYPKSPMGITNVIYGVEVHWIRPSPAHGCPWFLAFQPLWLLKPISVLLRVGFFFFFFVFFFCPNAALFNWSSFNCRPERREDHSPPFFLLFSPIVVIIIIYFICF